MVRLLGIVGSPRKGGNTEFVVREVLKAAEQEGAETELISLADYDLKPCDGCEKCIETKSCAINDDVEKIYEKVREVDGIVVGSPVYFFNTTAQVKTFIDRIGYLNIARGRKPFRNKVGGAVAVAARTGPANALSQISLFLSASRMITVAPLVTVLASAKGDAVKDKRGIEDAKELGKNLAQIAKATASLRETIP